MPSILFGPKPFLIPSVEPLDREEKARDCEPTSMITIYGRWFTVFRMKSIER